MFTKNNLKYILLLGIGFLWCSSLYLTQEQYLLNYMSSITVNIVDMLFGSLSMALGIFVFILLSKHNKNVKKIYLVFLIISIICSGLYFIVSPVTKSILLCLICLLGSAGFGCAYHFSLVSANVDKKYRGRVFAIGYTIGTIGTYLLSLLPETFIYSSFSLLVYIPLIVLNMFMIIKYGNINIIVVKTTKNCLNKYMFIICLLVFLMSIVTSFSSNLFSITNININSGFAYPRLYYSIGLIVAGILADKKNDYIEVFTLVSLFFPLMAVFFLNEGINPLYISCLNYIFIAFFVVFRTTIFMNLSDKKSNYIYLSALGLAISRVVEGLLVLINYYFNFNYIFLIISIIIILSLILIIYILFYYKKYDISNDDVISMIGIKYHLSSQELKVTELLLRDYTNQEIADNLYLSVNTVRNHIANIYKKTNMKKKDLKEIYILKSI